MRYWPVIVASFFLIPHSAIAQQGSTAGIYGTVTDPGNAVVPQATLTVRPRTLGLTVTRKF